MNKKIILISIIVIIIIAAILGAGLIYIVATNSTVSEIGAAVFEPPVDYPQVANLGELVVKDIVSNLKEDDGKIYIPAKQDDKYTYIDEKGNELIKDKFDVATEFITFKLDDKSYALACVYKDGKKLVIKQDGKVLFELKNPRDIQGLEEDVKYNEVGKTLDDLILNTLSGTITSSTILNTSKDQNFAANITTTCKQIKKTDGKFDYNDEYYIVQEEADTKTFESYAKDPRLYDSYDKYLQSKDKKYKNYNYYLVSKANEKDKIKLDCEDLIVKNDTLYVYEDGNIPFISVLANESGWFNSKGEKTKLQSCTMRVISLKNDAIVVVEPYKQSIGYTKSYIDEDTFNELKKSNLAVNNDNDTIYTVYALGLNGKQKTSKDYRILYMTKDGYILKNIKTGKYYVANSEFKLVYEDGFDLITPYLLDKGYIICGNKKDENEDSTYKSPSNYKYKIVDFNGNEILGENYDELYATVSLNDLATNFESLMVTNTSVMRLSDDINNKLLYRQLYIDRLDEREQEETNNNSNNN